MATRKKQYPETRYGWHAQTFYEAASQSFKKGDLLQIAAAGGAVSICATAGNDFDSQTSKRGLGIAMQDASGVTDAAIQVYVPTNNDGEFRVWVYHATPASAVTSKAMIGDTMVLTNVSASEGWAANIGSASNPTLKIMEVDPNYPIGELNGPVWVKWFYSAAGTQ